MQKILLIATGGTIASTKTEYGLAPGITSQELYDSVPEAGRFCTVDTVQLLNIDSTNVQPEQWILMAKTIEEHYDDYDGFVITHGTDTMAYTSSALSYLIQHPNSPLFLPVPKSRCWTPLPMRKRTCWMRCTLPASSAPAACL